MIEAVAHSYWMVGRQARNLFREPIWIVMMLVQPMIWLLLYSQLFRKPGRSTTRLRHAPFWTSSRPRSSS